MSDLRYLRLIRDSPWSTHSQLCPVCRNRGSRSVNCSCWRSAEVRRLLDVIDGVSEPLTERSLVRRPVSDGEAQQ